VATAVAPIPAVQDQGFRTAPRARRFQGVRRCRNPVRMSAINHPTQSHLVSAANDGSGASSPIRRVVSHRLQSADSGPSCPCLGTGRFDPRPAAPPRRRAENRLLSREEWLASVPVARAHTSPIRSPRRSSRLYAACRRAGAISRRQSEGHAGGRDLRWPMAESRSSCSCHCGSRCSASCSDWHQGAA
jgi:hypothetical protein